MLHVPGSTVSYRNQPKAPLLLGFAVPLSCASLSATSVAGSVVTVGSEGVGVNVGVAVFVAVFVAVAVFVGVNVFVAVGVGVNVFVALGVGVNVLVALGVGVNVLVAVAVGVNVFVADGVGVNVAVFEGVGVNVAVFAGVAVLVAVFVGVFVGVAAVIVTFWVLEAALKFVVAAPDACTTHVPAPVELNVDPLTKLHGPLTLLYVSVELSVLVVVALTLQFAPGKVGFGAVPKVMVGVGLVSFVTLTLPVVAAKYVLVWLVAVDVVEPHVPLIRPAPPSVKLATVYVVPVFKLAVADPVGAMLNVFEIVAPDGTVFTPLPDRVKLA